jgi:hypothetical protein
MKTDSLSKYRMSVISNFVSKMLQASQNCIDLASEGQEKYLRELSITPVGYFTGAIKNHSRA